MGEFQFRQYPPFTDGVIDIVVERQQPAEPEKDELPPENPMYQRGERQKCRYRWIVFGGAGHDHAIPARA